MAQEVSPLLLVELENFWNNVAPLSVEAWEYFKSIAPQYSDKPPDEFLAELLRGWVAANGPISSGPRTQAPAAWLT